MTANTANETAAGSMTARAASGAGVTVSRRTRP